MVIHKYKCTHLIYCSYFTEQQAQRDMFVSRYLLFIVSFNLNHLDLFKTTLAKYYTSVCISICIYV